MALNITDLQPKSFEVTIKGQTTECKPPRLSHIFILSKVGNLFQDPAASTASEVKQAEKDLDGVFEELIPELKGVTLEMQAVLDLITQIMNNVNPSENKELDEQGVKIDSDPKAERTG